MRLRSVEIPHRSFVNTALVSYNTVWPSDHIPNTTWTRRNPYYHNIHNTLRLAVWLTGLMKEYDNEKHTKSTHSTTSQLQLYIPDITSYRHHTRKRKRSSALIVQSTSNSVICSCCSWTHKNTNLLKYNSQLRTHQIRNGTTCSPT